MKRILVTGSEGMIGKELMILLKQDPENSVFGIDIKTGIDLRNKIVCEVLTKNYDEIYHLAGIKGNPKMTQERPNDFFTPMIQMNTNMIECARLNGVKKFLYTSSIAVLNPETDVYPAWAKLTGEKQIEAMRIQYNSTQYCIVRPANVYGRFDNFANPDAMVITSLIRKAIKEKEIEVWGDGNQIRDFINAKDVAKAMIKTMEVMPNDPINICSGKKYVLNEIADIISRLSNKEIVYVETMYGNKNRFMNNNLDLIEFIPEIDIETGIKEAYEWAEKTLQ